MVLTTGGKTASKTITVGVTNYIPPSTNTPSPGAAALSVSPSSVLIAQQVTATITVNSCDAYVVSWGDGSAPFTNTSPTCNSMPTTLTATHAYSSAGTYIVKLTDGVVQFTKTVMVTSSSGSSCTTSNTGDSTCSSGTVSSGPGIVTVLPEREVQQQAAR